jgi:hypothetical protein
VSETFHIESLKKLTRYEKIKCDLESLSIPDRNFEVSVKLKRLSKKFFIRDGRLFYKNNGSNCIVVMHVQDRRNILSEHHDGRAHFEVQANFAP